MIAPATSISTKARSRRGGQTCALATKRPGSEGSITRHRLATKSASTYGLDGLLPFANLFSNAPQETLCADVLRLGGRAHEAHSEEARRSALRRQHVRAHLC